MAESESVVEIYLDDYECAIPTALLQRALRDRESRCSRVKDHDRYHARDRRERENGGGE